MKNLIFTSFFIFSIGFWSHSQNNGQLWLEAGLKTKITPDLAINAELNNRIGSNGLSTSFTQLSVKYKVFKWLSTSLDYRIISKKQENTNYLNSCCIFIVLTGGASVMGVSKCAKILATSSFDSK